MRTCEFTLSGARLTALPSGALWWSERGILCVSDLHFGKAMRPARHGGAVLPPYDNAETLTRLETDILTRNPETVICLGDSFDSMGAEEEMAREDHNWLVCLMAGRRWIWIAGNHDPGPVALGGAHLSKYRADPLVFRHEADPDATGEVSGHFHPKTAVNVRGRHISRPCFLVDDRRVILPAYGTFTGGLRADAPVLRELMSPNAMAIMTGKKAQQVPLHL
jgi:DNA ligase-associated metallophosphoesterase